MKSKTEKEKIELKKRLARALRIPCNKTCADCPETRPTWISFIKPQQNFALGSKVLASFVCLECAGLHRKLGTHICVVRSISHDQFESKDVESAEYSGNDVVNEIFEGHLQKSTMDGINIKPLLGAEVARRERFIRQKYVDLYFYRKRAHYQHIAEVNKMISNARKPKSTSSKSRKIKLTSFLHDEKSVKSEKDDKKSSGCSTTVGNTTITRTNTSRRRTVSDRDDSKRSDKHKSRDKKSKRRSSKSGKPSSSRKKGQKKSSSQRRLKSKDSEDPMYERPSSERGTERIGETSAQPNQPNIRKDLKLISSTMTGANRRDSKGNDDLSGMILVFDEESFESMESLDRDRQRRRSSRDIDHNKRNITTGAASKRNTIQSQSVDGDHSKELTKKPLTKSSNESCDNRHPLATPSRDVRKSRSEITVDKITKKSVSARSLDFKSTTKKDTPHLKAHLMLNATNMQRTDVGNMNIPYLNAFPMSPVSVEGIVSEETSYGFGDNTVNNMSGTGEMNKLSNHLDHNTEHGFRVIDSDTVSDRSSSCKGVSWEAKGSFSLPFKNKKATDGAIKNQSGKRSQSVENRLSHRDQISATAIRAESCSDINKSNRSMGNKSKSNRSLGNRSMGNKSKSSRSIGNKSVMSVSNTSIFSNKSNRSIGNRSNTSISINDPITRIHPRQPKSQVSLSCDSPPLKKKRSSKKQKGKKSRSKGSKSEKKLNMRNQALLDEWERLKTENQKKVCRI